MVCWLAGRALAANKHVGILTRGYRGSDGSSDEVALLQRRLGESVPIGVGPNRYAKGKELEARDVEWFILDDGFQHLQLARDVDILLIDATDPFGGRHLLPAGRLREPISALRRADVIVITRCDRAPAVELVVRRYSAAPIYYAQTKLERVVLIVGPGAQSGDVVDSTDRHARKVFAFCGIGNPKAFLSDLDRWGVKVAGWMAFVDHHRYSEQEMNEIERRAREAGADALLCTEKDVFNLGQVSANEFLLAHCVISLAPNDPEKFWRDVNSIASSRRARTAQ
jgi:tetraacyldisaccharide 4'-kinase